jgi:RNA polymerase sigma-70 factor (ECF subfamily)
VVSGDREAFERLYRRYYERLFRFSLRVTGRIHLVGDVINETMMVVWRRASEYRAAAQVSTWIFGIAYRKSLKALARDGRHNAESLDDVPEIELQMAETVDRDAIHAEIRQAIACLPPDHRAVVDLTFHFNRSYEENCADPGLPGGHGEIAHVPRSRQIAPIAGPSAGGLMP